MLMRVVCLLQDVLMRMFYLPSVRCIGERADCLPSARGIDEDGLSAVCEMYW